MGMQYYDNRIKDRLRAGICLAVALVMASILTVWLVKERGLLLNARAAEVQEKLAGEVLRFHVLANSDSDEDQAVKMQVKEAVLAYMKQSMPSLLDAKETKDWVTAHLEDLNSVAADTLMQAGSTYAVSTEVTTDYFPVKTYGDITFPAGQYEALRIKIGQARGQNWWCCLYPNLCFTDAVHAVVPEEGKEELKEVLDDTEYEMVTASSDFKIKWFLFGEKEEE